MVNLKERKYILFDLDGTVIDSVEGIYNGLRYTYKKLNMEVPTDEFFHQFVGPSVVATFKTLYNLDDNEAQRWYSIYREYYSTKGLLECSLYKGIKKLILKLKEQDKYIALATKKPEEFAKIMLRNLEIESLFDVICGSKKGDMTHEKGYVLDNAMTAMGVTSKSEVIMIGDTKFDCIGANQAGVECVGVTYGYGEKQDLIDYKCVEIVDTILELEKVLLG